MSHCRARGIVLQVTDHGEADKIVTLYSPDIGRVTGIAKGAKRSQKRFVNKLEGFSLLQFLYRPARSDGLLLLSEADLEDSHLEIRTHYDRYVAATHAAELLLRFTREHDPEPELFALLLWALRSLAAGREPLAVAAYFQLRLLGLAGYEPQLSRCGFCDGGVENGSRFALHSGRGVLVCSRCQEMQPAPLLAVSVQTLKFLQHAQRADLQNLARLRLSRANALEALTVLHRYSQHLLQHDIHAWQQLRRLAAAQSVP